MMWTMGYNEGGEFNTIQDPFTGRKLRPLMPRQATAASTSPPPCFTRIHGSDLLALNHHLAMGEQNKRDQLISTQQVVVSSRWNPTPEQLQTLEELYRSGTRTPSAEQIQQITAQLRKYGKIEGKNVFYWFQNHKARERQKRRRQQLESLPDEQQITRTNHHTQNGEKRELPPGAASAAAANRTVFEVEQTKNWASPTNSSTVAEKTTVCTQGAAVEAECKAAVVVDGGGWAQFDDDAELLQQRRNATWQMINLSCSSSSITNPNHGHLITTSSISSALTATAIRQTNYMPHGGRDSFISIFPNTYDINHFASGCEGTQTLQLFPLRSSTKGCPHGTDQEDDEDGELGVAMDAVADHDAAPYQFFEFLPIKN